MTGDNLHNSISRLIVEEGQWRAPCWLDPVVAREQRSRASEGQKHPRASTQVLKDRPCCWLSGG